MKPPPTFVNKSNLVILLVYLFVVGMSSHPVNILDLSLGNPLSDESIDGGGYEQPSPLSGVIVACGGIDFGWGGEIYTLAQQIRQSDVFAYEVKVGNVLGRVWARIGWEYIPPTSKHITNVWTCL